MQHAVTVSRAHLRDMTSHEHQQVVHCVAAIGCVGSPWR